jgi:hypothetical protein
MVSEAARIRKRQERAQARLTKAEGAWDATDPAYADKFKALEEDAALSEREVATLEAAAKVAALLEKVPEKEDDEEKPVSEAEKADRLARLEQTGPAKVSRATDAEDGT